MKSAKQADVAKTALLHYFAILLASVTALQIFIAVRGNHIDGASQVILAAIAVYYIWFNTRKYELLSHVRYGRLVAHLIGFLTVTMSYHLHAFILYVSGSTVLNGTSDFAIDRGWFGVLFGMTTFWGIGLLIHMVQSVLHRGFEEIN